MDGSYSNASLHLALLFFFFLEYRQTSQITLSMSKRKEKTIGSEKKILVDVAILFRIIYSKLLTRKSFREISTSLHPSSNSSDRIEKEMVFSTNSEKER